MVNLKVCSIAPPCQSETLLGTERGRSLYVAFSIPWPATDKKEGRKEGDASVGAKPDGREREGGEEGSSLAPR